MHSEWRSIFCNANCNCGCLTWAEAARSLCWGVHSFSIKAAFQASSPLCLRTSLIKAAASMYQSYLGRCTQQEFLSVEQLGGACNWFNFFYCWSKVSQPPIPITAHKEIVCLQEHKQLSDTSVNTKIKHINDLIMWNKRNMHCSHLDIHVYKALSMNMLNSSNHLINALD